MEYPAQTHDIAIKPASAVNGPKNSWVVPCGLYSYNPSGNTGGVLYTKKTGLQQGTDCEEVQGCWITEAYPSVIRWRITFEQIVPIDNQWPSISVRVIHGVYKNTLEKLGASTHNAPTSINEGLVHLKEELFNSQVSSDHLEFPEKNRRIQILSDKRHYPGDLQLFSVDNTAGAAYRNMPPPLEGIFRFPHHALKQKLMKMENPGPQELNMCPFFSWIPFTVFMCDELMSDQTAQQKLTLSYATKYYFRDL